MEWNDRKDTKQKNYFTRYEITVLAMFTEYTFHAPNVFQKNQKYLA